MGIQYLDLDREFSVKTEMIDIFKQYYTHPNSPEDAGHLSVEGNAVAARILINAICDDDFLKIELASSRHCSARAKLK